MPESFDPASAALTSQLLKMLLYIDEFRDTEGDKLDDPSAHLTSLTFLIIYVIAGLLFYPHNI